MTKIISVFTFILVAIVAAGQSQSSARTIRITGTRFTYPLLQKWIDEYAKVNPAATIRIQRVPADSADILIASHFLRPGDVKEGYSSLTLNRYILLPVANSERSDLPALQQKGITAAALKEIFFTGKQNSTASNPGEWIVYKRAQPSCSSIAFAHYFGNDQKDITGVPVPGDDRDLLASVKKDKNAISYNSPGIIYNIKTRKVVDSIAVIPIDLDNNGVIDQSEKIYTTLDDLIRYAGQSADSRIPVDEVHAIIKNNQDKDVAAFLKWVLVTGQQYNHEYGYLNLDAQTIQSEKDQLAVLATRSCSPSGRQLINNTVSK